MSNDSKPAADRGSECNDLLGLEPERDAMPPWLLPLHEATLIANMHRVRVGAVQAIAKATHAVLQAEVERLRVTLANESRRVCGTENDCVLQPHCSHAQKCMRPEWDAKA